MKKLLRLLVIISCAAPLPSYAVACTENSLKDNTLKAIYNSNKTNFTIHELVDSIAIPTKPAVTPYVLTNDQLKTLAETAAMLMLKDQGIETVIPWYNASSAEVNQNYYLFQITNGTETTDGKTWDVIKETQIITINLNYQVGKTDNNKKFIASEQISKSLKVKCGLSQSDENVKVWVENFNNLTKKWKDGLAITSSDKKLDLPADGSTWDDIDKAWKKLVYTTISTAIQNEPWEASDTVTFKILSEDNKTKDNQLKITLNANQSNTELKTNSFIIKFNENKL